MAAEVLQGFKMFCNLFSMVQGQYGCVKVKLVRAADVPEPTIRPTEMSVSNSVTQKGQLAPFEVSLLWQHWT